MSLDRRLSVLPSVTISYGRHVQDDGDVPVPIRGGAPLAGFVRQAPDHRVTRLALTSAASTPPVLTSNTARQHCMVCLNALTRHLQPQVIQARERAQVRAIKGIIGHVEVFQMDGVGTPIIGRPRPLPGHDTPNPANNTYTLKCEEPFWCVVGSVKGVATTPKSGPLDRRLYINSCIMLYERLL